MRDRSVVTVACALALAACASGSSSGTVAGSGGTNDSNAGHDAGSMNNGSNLTGTLGALGAVQPIMAGWATTNGLETLIYLSTTPLSCAMMMTQGARWLGKLPSGSQVIEIVIGQPSSAKTYNLGTETSRGGGEVNYAEGSKSSSSEVQGAAGSVTLTKAGAKGVQEGMINVTAPFKVSGSFHADWCEGATEF